MATVIDRTWYNTLVDDDGSNLVGSVWDKADVDALMDAIDALFTGAFSLVGPLTVTGFGTHQFTAGGTGVNGLDVTNTTDGAANLARVRVLAGTTIGGIYVQPQSFTTDAPFTQAGTTLYGFGAGGIDIAAVSASGVIRFYSGGTTERMRLDTVGSLSLTATGSNTGVLVGAAAGSWGARLVRSGGGGLLLGVPGTTSADHFTIVSSGATDLFDFNGVGNLSLGAYAARATTVGTRAIQLFDGTPPAGTLANGVSLYSSGGKLFAMSAAGVATQLTP